MISVNALRIIRAREESLARINDLIARSKSYWGWPAEYLEKALRLHKIEPSYLRSNQCFELLDVTDELAAFLAVAISDAKVVLDNLWVRPDLIGKGVGRQACEHVFRLAREHEWTELWVLPDHPAIGFYEKMGSRIQANGSRLVCPAARCSLSTASLDHPLDPRRRLTGGPSLQRPPRARRNVTRPLRGQRRRPGSCPLVDCSFGAVRTAFLRGEGTRQGAFRHPDTSRASSRSH